MTPSLQSGMVPAILALLLCISSAMTEFGSDLKTPGLTHKGKDSTSALTKDYGYITDLVFDERPAFDLEDRNSSTSSGTTEKDDAKNVNSDGESAYIFLYPKNKSGRKSTHPARLKRDIFRSLPLLRQQRAAGLEGSGLEGSGLEGSGMSTVEPSTSNITSQGTTVAPDLKTNITQHPTHVICADNYMRIELKRSVDTSIHEDYLQLNDPACKFYSNGSYVIANMSLNTCGTVMEDDGTNLIFRNKVVSADNPNAIITRKYDVEIDFYCSYPKTNQVLLQFKGHRPMVTFTEKSFGTFTYQFEFFESNQFSQVKDPNTYPLVFNLGDMMYMQIESTSSIPNTELFAESCKAAPTDDPDETVFYPIIRNGCKVDSTVQIYSKNQANVQIAMKAFKFIGQHDQVFITCSVILCQAGDTDSRCSKGCINPAHQVSRRETHTQTASHYISQGPLRLRRDVASKIHNKTTKKHINLNLVFLAGGTLAVVAMVCAMVLYKR